ncbi:hypothetical protein GCM10010347_26990 [Streptomyces cirratus]|uniref:Uncharacterized protein n=1 Tax=Streptomyces cirratus TaxID=68187 RepID=A0ABQ3EUB2_9ACTN|nr:hypothetical protein GCM10010347_26990 [Streptomyces cirratus]
MIRCRPPAFSEPPNPRFEHPRPRGRFGAATGSGHITVTGGRDRATDWADKYDMPSMRGRDPDPLRPCAPACPRCSCSGGRYLGNRLVLMKP